MSWCSRIANVFRANRLSREIDEELESHLHEAVAQGRDPAEARKAFGSPLRMREQSRDVRLIPWLDSLWSDLRFGWRQISKSKVASAAAILSLGLALGACTAAFRLVDALFWRPMPVANPERLYAMATLGYGPGGDFRRGDSNEYPQFAQMRAAVKGLAEMIAVSWTERSDLTYGSQQEMEKAYRQYVSGWMFGTFGLKPALGRLLTESDDVTPKAHPVAVLSYSYWKSRFGQDPAVLGRTFLLGDDLFQIVGVAPEGFSGTEPGTMADLFLPTMMHAGVTHSDWSWIRTFVALKPGVDPAPVRDRLEAVFRAIQTERAKGFKGWPKQRLVNFLNQKLVLEHAASGESYMQQSFRLALTVLGVLVALVLFIACANVANLLTARSEARAREMALRVSIGAGRGRLAQLMLAESALLAILASAVSVLFSWWAAPFVVNGINPPDDPARLALPADWRVSVFAFGLAIAVTVLFGLAPALRASGVKPVSALKGGEDPHSKRRLMHALIAGQVAFCLVVVFIAHLLTASFDRLTKEPTGFSADRLLALTTIARPAQPLAYWDHVVDHLRGLPGVEQVAVASWPLLSGNGQNGFVSINGGPPGDKLAYFLNVSPGWLDIMKILLIDGRDFRPNDTTDTVAIVNEEFAREYFQGQNPVGKSFERKASEKLEIIGLVRDARYRNMREPITATAYRPIRIGGDEKLGGAAIFVRSRDANPLPLAPMLRREVSRARSEFRVSNVQTQAEINRAQTARERLIAVLALFFAAVALLLAGIGLFGVLDYSVLQRRREIGIRMAIGARAGEVARRITLDVFTAVIAGALAGAGIGAASGRYIEALLYHVKSTDPAMLALPALALLAAAIVAALPPVIRAVRTDPAMILRSE